MPSDREDPMADFNRFCAQLCVMLVAAPLLALAGMVVFHRYGPPSPPPPPVVSPETCLGSGGKLVTTGGKYNSVDCLGVDGTRVKVFIEGGRRP